MKHLPLIICLAGLILYLLPLKEAKVTEVGRIAFWVGLLAVLLGWKG